MKRYNSWATLDMNDKIDFLNDLVAEYSKAYKTPNIYIKAEYDSRSLFGYYSDATKSITFNTNPQVGIVNAPADEVLAHFAHEYSHAIDHIAPSKGSVGPQIMKNNLFYTNEGPSYPLSMTEQGAFTNEGFIVPDLNTPLKRAKEILGQ